LDDPLPLLKGDGPHDVSALIVRSDLQLPGRDLEDAINALRIGKYRSSFAVGEFNGFLAALPSNCP